MNTRRSLLTFGALLAAFALLSPGVAHAQTVTDGSVTVETGSATGSIVVNFTGDTVGALDMFEIQYRVYAASNTTNQGWMDHATVGATAVKSTITGLNYEKEYEARVRVVVESTGNTSNWVVSTDDTGTADVNEGRAMPAQPEKPVRVASPSVTPGDMMLMVEWLEPASELDITLYRVYYMAEDGAQKEKLVLAPSTSTTLTSLMNGTEYTIEVSAESAAGEGPKSRKVMAMPMAGATPTPALPLFGAFALGAGLLAAGRARLRRREQRQLTR